MFQTGIPDVASVQGQNVNFEQLVQGTAGARRSHADVEGGVRNVARFELG